MWVLAVCPSSSAHQKSSSTVTTPFTLKNKGYTLTGQINNVSGSRKIALFFHGSGVIDRWETMPASETLDGKPSPTFKIISNELNKNGVSTCVYDKRAFNEKGSPLYEKILKTDTFENIKSDANAVFQYIESLHKYDKIILIGHSEGTVTASEIAFDHKDNPHISSLILIGVLAENLKSSLRRQMTDIIAQNTFKSVDKNKDGKIYPKDVPENLKAGLPIDKIDTQKKGYITYQDLITILNAQWNEVENLIQKSPADGLVMNKPVQWYRDFYNRKTLIQRANEYTHPVLIVHGELDKHVFYKDNAVALTKKMKKLKKEVTLKSFPLYGHGLSPEKDGLPTLGPIQQDAVNTIVNWALLH